ncbi:MAG: type II toxin-antitoxin system VapC family toxin [Thermaerobacter sp.]|nr:type II toxin-antitoxin system VapC family toxin [Thermaerobacter sp.]
MIYLDSSAVVKLVRWEAQSAELVAWLVERSDSALVSSCLVEVEVTRAIRRYDPAALAGVPGVIARLYRVEIDARIRARDAAYEDGLLRNLDAIHLATAEMLATETHELEAVVAYDERLLSAALAHGFSAVSPGVG